MGHRIRLALAASMFVLIVMSAVDRSAPRVLACGPFPWYPLFTPEHAPEDRRFAAGTLGILQTTYNRRYLLVAWRTFAGRPLLEAERRAYPAPPAPPIPGVPITRRRTAVDVWLDARRTVAVDEVTNDIRQETFLTPTYSFILNCGDSAFQTAAHTLEARAQVLGPRSPELAAWVVAQDSVFSNCDRRPNQPSRIPDPLDLNASPAARADRVYQIAAAQFYAGRFTDAEAGFTAIARDAASPWRTIAPYLAARAMIRQGTMGGKEAQGDPAALARAREALQTIIANPALAEMHAPANGLLRFVMARMDPAAALVETARAVVEPEPDAETFNRRLRDFEMLMDRFLDRAASSGTTAEDLATVRASSDLVDWIITCQRPDDDSLSHALERWNRTKSDTWLLAALAMLPPGHERQSDLLLAAKALPVSSPAYPTIAFHHARLLLLTGEFGQARAVLGRALATPGLPVSSVNLLKAARLLTARTLDEFLADALRQPVGDPGFVAEYQAPYPYSAPSLDRDAVDVLNEQMPLSMLRDIGNHRRLPSTIRRDIRLAVLTRAVLLGDGAAVRSAIPEALAVAPALSSTLKALATPADDRTLLDESVLFLLGHPGLHPFLHGVSDSAERPLTTLDSLRDNWWCSFQAADGGGSAYETLYWRGGSLQGILKTLRRRPDDRVELRFLTDADRRSVEREWQTLQHVETAPIELGQRAIAWVELHQSDPRAPKVLYQVVRATRYGCTNERTGAISHRAFALLHSRYPGSEWAKRTPFWFN